jgi:Zn-dependent M28 family amino/carboxypeptidase
MKKAYLLSAVILALGTGAYAQQNATALKFSKYINVQDAKKHLNIIASDDFEGRETGRPGAQKAASYLAAEFKKLGLTAPVNGSYFMDVPLTESSFKVGDFSVNGTKVSEADYFVYGSYADKNVAVPEVVFVGYGTDAEIGTTNLAGKVVVWINEDKPVAGATANTGFRRTPARRAVYASLESKSPAVIIAVNNEVTGVVTQFGATIRGSSFGIKKENVKKPVQAQVGMVNVSTAVADQFFKASGKTYADLKSAAAGAGVTAQVIKTPVKIEYHTQIVDTKAQDVLGFMPGSDPKLKDEVLVFSAHYDHIGLNNGTDKVNNGADDDGSGTTAILEIASAFSQAKKAGKGPRRSILFLGNVGEEKGLLGSEWYTDHPLYPLSNTIADLNIDMIGRIDTTYAKKTDSADYVYVVGSEKLSTELKQISESINGTYTKLKLDYMYDDPKDPEQIYYRSDHYNFAKHGVPIAFYTSGLHKQYHQPDDEVRFINFPALVKRTQLVGSLPIVMPVLL